MKKDDFLNDPLWDKNKELKTKINTKIASSKYSDLAETFESFMFVSSLLDKVETSGNYIFFEQEQLNTIKNILRNSLEYLDQIDTNTPSYSRHLSDSLTTFGREVMKLYSIVKSLENTQTNPIKELTETYVESLKQARDFVIKDVDGTKAELEKVNNEIEAKSKRFDSFEQKVTSEIDEMLSKKASVFDELHTSKQTELDTMITDARKSIELHSTPNLEKLTDLVEKYDSFKERLEKLVISTESIADAAAGDQISKKYEEKAKDERATGWIGYGVGLGALLLGLVLFFFYAGNLFSENILKISWQAIAFKLIVTTILGSISAVSIRFGSQAFYRSTEFSRQHLEIASLVPFLSQMENSEDQATREQAQKAKIAYLQKAYGSTWSEKNLIPPNSDLANDFNNKLFNFATQVLSSKEKKESEENK